MGLTSLLYTIIIFMNAICILNQERFLMTFGLNWNPEKKDNSIKHSNAVPSNYIERPDGILFAVLVNSVSKNNKYFVF